MLARRSSQPGDEAFLRSVYASTRANEIGLFGWHSSQAEIFLRMQFDAQDRHFRLAYPDAQFDIVVRLSVCMSAWDFASPATPVCTRCWSGVPSLPIRLAWRRAARCRR